MEYAWTMAIAEDAMRTKKALNHLDALFLEHAEAKARLREAGVSEHRIEVLFPDSIQDYTGKLEQLLCADGVLFIITLATGVAHYEFHILDRRSGCFSKRTTIKSEHEPRRADLPADDDHAAAGGRGHHYLEQPAGRLGARWSRSERASVHNPAFAGWPMSARFDQRWASERLLDFALTFDAASQEMRELRENNVSAQRIFNLYPLDINSWVSPLRAAFSNEAVAKSIWLEGNSFDSYQYILRRLAESDDQAQSMAAKWNFMLQMKGDSMAATNAAWNVAVFLTVLERLATIEGWQELRRNEVAIARIADFENVIERVLQKASKAL